MDIHDHSPTAGGRAFMWGGIGLGLLLIVLLLTHGFGLFGGRANAAGETPALVHKGEQIFVPQDSPLRQRLTVLAAPAQSSSAMITAPGSVESDPARTVTVLPPGTGRVHELKVALGDHVQRGQALVIIDSPDLAQAYADNDKAASAATLAAKNLKYQQAQFKIGAAAQKDLDQTRSDNSQAVAEYTRTRVHCGPLVPRQRPTVRPGSSRCGRRWRGASRCCRSPVGPPSMTTPEPLMTIADLSVVWVTALVAEKDVASVARNQDAEVSIDAYPGKTLHGKVLFVSDVIEADSRRDKNEGLAPDALARVTKFFKDRKPGG